jgi:xylan 1,4-beta-xylosidase
MRLQKDLRRFIKLLTSMNVNRLSLILSFPFIFFGGFQTISAGEQSFPVIIDVDAGKALGELKPVWRFFGADEPNYAYMKNGEKLLAELGTLASNRVYFRAHNLLTSGDGTPALKWGSTGAYTADAAGKGIYDWKIVDRIFDVYLKKGVRPYVEIGFMPEALSIKPEPYQHHWNPKLGYNEIYTGWAYPPNDYRKWGELVYEWAKHSVEGYGREEVEKWYWEVWNEPNIGYWKGSPKEFHQLHDFATDAVRRALPSARVGGPDVAGSGGKFMRDFLEHALHGTNYATGKVGTPLDFISFHAKGAPTTTNGHVRMGISAQLRTVEDGFRIISSYPELKGKPIVIGESDPEGCAACQGPALAYRNGTMYSSYTAASFARIYELAVKQGVNLEGVLTWAFEFEDQPYFAGFRSLASNGIDKPVLNVFRMFSIMGGTQIQCESNGEIGVEQITQKGVRGKADVGAIATWEGNRVTVLVWHYHDDDVEGPDAAVQLNFSGLREKMSGAKVSHYRVDGEHSNAFAVWKKMGSPQDPTETQYKNLERAGQLAVMSSPGEIVWGKDNGTIKFQLPRQAVSLIQIDLSEEK